MALGPVAKLVCDDRDDFIAVLLMLLDQWLADQDHVGGDLRVGVQVIIVALSHPQVLHRKVDFLRLIFNLLLQPVEFLRKWHQFFCQRTDQARVQVDDDNFNDRRPEKESIDDA